MNIDSTAGNDTPPARFNEENRRRQLIEVTIDSLAELGYLGTTLAQIAGRAGVTPGLVAHYFGDKDGLLADAFRTLVRRVSKQVRVRLASAGTPRDRIHAGRKGSGPHPRPTATAGRRAELLRGAQLADPPALARALS